MNGSFCVAAFSFGLDVSGLDVPGLVLFGVNPEAGALLADGVVDDDCPTHGLDGFSDSFFFPLEKKFFTVCAAFDMICEEEGKYQGQILMTNDNDSGKLWSRQTDRCCQSNMV